MSIRSRLPLRPLSALLALAALLLLPTRSGAAPAAPAVSQLALLTTPTLGGQARVIWAGATQLAPESAELTFAVMPPNGARPRVTKKSLALARGRAADASFSFPTPRPGVYQVHASLRVKAGGKEHLQRSELQVSVAPPPARRSRMAALAKASPLAKKPRATARKLVVKDPQELALKGRLYNGELSAVGEVDWWHFRVEKDCVVDIDLTDYDHYDLSFRLYDKDLNEPLNSGDYGLRSPRLAPGDYYLSVSSEDTTNSYQFRARKYELDNLPELKLNGTSRDGELTTSTQVDWYRFSVKEKTPVWIELNKSDFGSFLVLYDKDLNEALGYGGARIVQALSPGEYYVAVTSEYEDEKGPYQISVITPDTPAPLAVGGEPLWNNFFYGDAEADWYRFEIKTAGDYIIETADTDGTKLALYGPDGRDELLERDDDGGSGYAAMISRRLDPGTYYVKVEPGNSNDFDVSVGYTIAVSKGARKVTELAVDGPAHQDQFQAEGDYDRYRFTVDKSGFYTVECTPAAAGCLRLYHCGANEDEVIDWRENSVEAGKPAFAMQYALDPGVYYFKLQRATPPSDDDDYDDDYDYKTRSLDDEGETPDPLSYQVRVRTHAAPVLEVGGAQRAVTLSNASPQGWFQFTVKRRGEHAILALLPFYSNWPTITLYDRNLEKIGTSANDGGAPIMSATLDPGVYYFQLSCHFGYWVDEETYKVMILDHQVQGLDVHYPSSDDDGWVTGSIRNPGDEAWFLFCGGVRNYMIRTRAGSLTDTAMSVYGLGDDATLVAGDDDSGKGRMAQVSVFLKEWGYYFVKVRASQAGARGDFSIQVEEPEFSDIGILGEKAELLTEGDIGHFSYENNDESTRTIELIADTLPSCTFRLYACEYDQNGEPQAARLVAEQRVENAADFRFTPPLKKGDYYIEIVAAKPTDVGKYFIRARKDLLDIKDAHYNLLSDEIVKGGDANWITFDLAEADYLLVELALNTLDGGVLQLYGPGDATRFVAEAATGGERSCSINRFLEAGRYYVKVQGASAASRGLFSVQARPFYTRLRLGARPVRDYLSYANETDYFAFNVARTTSVTVETFTKPDWDLEDNVLSLYGPDDPGRLAASDDDSAEYNLARIVATLTPGRYFVRVQGKTPSDYGTYSIQARESNTTLTLGGGWVAAALRDPNEDEWFHFTVPVRMSVVIDTHNEGIRYSYGSLPDGVMELYSTSSTTPLATDEDSGPGAMPRIRRVLDPGIVYSVRVKGSGAEDDLGYFLVRVREFFPYLAIGGDGLSGEIDDPTDAEWFAFKVETAGDYTVQSDYVGYGSTLFWLSLCGPNSMAPLGMVETNPADGVARNTVRLEPGWYYVSVKGKTENDLGVFTVKVSPAAAAAKPR